MEADPGASFEAVADLGPGLVPGVQVIQAGAAVIARTTAGIVEAPAGTYTATMTAPATAGKYTLVWDAGAVAAGSMAIEDLLVGDTSIDPGDSWETVADLLASGLVGTAGIQVTDDSDSSVVIAHTTAGIAEFPASSGIYWTLLTAPAAGDYTVVWDNGAGEEATEALVVPGAAGPCDPWATVDELARILKIRTPSAEQTAAMDRVLRAAAGEICAEIDRAADADALATWQNALAEQVNLERAAELWELQEIHFGVVGLGSEFGATHIARNTWDKHAYTLAPLKAQWGLA